MKNYIYSSLILSSVLALAACSADEPGVVKNDSTVSLTVQLPTEHSTRFADGKSIDILYYSILSADGTTVLAYDSIPWVKNATSASVPLDLIPTQNYQVVFFAMNSKATGYAFDAKIANFTVNYEEMQINNDDYDAFVAKVPDINTEYDTTENPIVLSRPFAQINIGTNDLDSKIVTSYGLENFTTIFTVEKDNLATGVSYLTSGANNMTFTPATKGITKNVEGLTDTAGLADKFPVAGYKYLNMLYLLVNPGNASNGQAVLNTNFSTTIADGTQVQNIPLPTLPAKANYQTNIYGKLLTSSKDFNVTIAPAFDGTLLPNAVSDANTAIDALNNNNSLVFNGTTEELDLSALSNTKPVEIILASGASVDNIKVGSNRTFAQTAPVTISVAKDVKFPTFVPTFKEKYNGVNENYPIYNLTIIGDPTASIDNCCKGFNFYGSNVNEINGITFKGVHFDGKGVNVEFIGNSKNTVGVHNITIEDCVFTNLTTEAFTSQQHENCGYLNTDYTIRNNEITFASTGVPSNVNGMNMALATPGKFIIENNTITNPTYHGIQLYGDSYTSTFTADNLQNASVIVSGNTVVNAKHDGIKLNYIWGTVNIFNNNVTAFQYGIRVARFYAAAVNANPIVSIYNNTIDMSKAESSYNGIVIQAGGSVGPFKLFVNDNIKAGGNPTEWFAITGLTPDEGSDYANPFSN